MILKGFKEKSIKKQLNFILKTPRKHGESSKIKSLGVVVNASEVVKLDVFQAISQQLNIRQDMLKIVSFTTDKNENALLGNVSFNAGDISWGGKIANPELQSFVNTNFDVLISYYTQDVTALKYITAISKAKFKVGIFKTDDRLNDLIINTEINQTDNFKTELYKYLKVLNKI